MVLTRRNTLLLAVGLASGTRSFAHGLDAPNVVTIAPLLVTSGQPSPAALAGLGRLGFEAVIYLAPSTVPDAVANEPDLLAKQCIEFVHIPIPFSSPEESHFLAVSAALKRLQPKKVLVHCQVNMRASSIVFLHRVLIGHENPELAYEAVAQVWSPVGAWRELLRTQLRKHNVNFQPY